MKKPQTDEETRSGWGGSREPSVCGSEAAEGRGIGSETYPYWLNDGKSGGLKTASRDEK